MQETFLGNQDDNTNISMSKAPLNEVDDKIRVAKSVSESQVFSWSRSRMFLPDSNRPIQSYFTLYS